MDPSISIILDLVTTEQKRLIELKVLDFQNDGRSLGDIKHISIHDDDCCDITFLKYFKHIETLSISNFPNLEDISIIKECKNLKKIWITHCNVKDISVLNSLNQLQEVYLRGNKLVDITPLGGLYKLWELDLSYNKIVDVSALFKLQNLIWCNLCKTSVSSKQKNVIDKLTRFNCHFRGVDFSYRIKT
jgi:Leucine-rich repeat (LRR) protein